MSFLRRLFRIREEDIVLDVACRLGVYADWIA